MKIATPTPSRSLVRDDAAYVAPMAAFLLLLQVGTWWPSLYTAAYVTRAITAAMLVALFWQHYTKIRWNYWWLGAIMGVIGVVQWVGMEKLLLHFGTKYPHVTVEPFNPFQQIHSQHWRWAFIAVRWASAVLVVPVMEELFWRDFVWRTTLAPNDFKLAEVGEPDWTALLVVSAFFCAVHVQWITAVVWGLMIGGLLILTRSLGACIIMHAVTNFLLGLYVLRTGDWYFW